MKEVTHFLSRPRVQIAMTLLGLGHLGWYHCDASGGGGGGDVEPNGLKLRPRRVMRALVLEGVRMVDALTPRDVANVVWAMGAANVNPRGAMDALLGRLECAIPTVQRAQVRSHCVPRVEGGSLVCPARGGSGGR